MSAWVSEYVSDGRDYLITERITGQDGITHKYLDQPQKLCDVFSESLRALHEVDFSDCPHKNRTDEMVEAAQEIYKTGAYDTWLLAYMDVKTPEEGYRLLQEQIPLVKHDALLHGDYCLPNILLDDFKFTGFIDVGNGGAGDRHFDLFWGIWTLQYNLQTNAFMNRFLDGYGREKVDLDRLKLNGIIAAFNR